MTRELSRATALVTGSSGLIGSAAVMHFNRLGAKVHGIDNNLRAEFFGGAGDTRQNLEQLQNECPGYVHHRLDIRDREAMQAIVRELRPNLIIHAAAQPSHDLAADRPFLDFDVNAAGTLNLLEATRRGAPEAVFVHMSTNKVYGDQPNQLPLVERERRFDYAREEDFDGIDESMSIDQSTHSLFGASKVAGDVMAQEYGRYFGLQTCVLRGGCLTGSRHAGAEQHGFLNYLARVLLAGKLYTIFGYKGKQVRDQIHAEDVARAIEAVYARPCVGEVFNLGGGRPNAASVLECIDLLEQATGQTLSWDYSESARKGDHVCYITNMGKFRRSYPEWTPEWTLAAICEDMVAQRAETV